MKKAAVVLVAVMMLVGGEARGQSNAAGFSLASDLAKACSGPKVFHKVMCDFYIRGVVEAWFLATTRFPEDKEKWGDYSCSQMYNQPWELIVTTVRSKLGSIKDRSSAAVEVLFLLNDTFCRR